MTHIAGIPLFRLLSRVGAGFALIVLVACAPVRTRGDAASLRAQALREYALREQPRWSLAGRIAVSNGEDGGNAQIDWRQDGDRYDLRVHAPVTGKTWHLFFDGRDAVLEGVGSTSLRDRSAANLLQREVGWQLPVAEMEFWVRAMRAPATAAEIEFDAHSLPAVLTQSGWTVEFRDYFADGAPRLPRKVFASRGKQRVRLFVERWQAE